MVTGTEIDGEIPSRLRNGMTYRGAMVDGKKEGRGEIVAEDGTVMFAGAFKNDLPEGKCTRYVQPDGTIYFGDMSRGLRSGMGQLCEGNKPVYEGFWSNDVPHGRGTLTTNDGVYEGEFRAGKRHGKGQFVFREHPLANGKQRVYEGDWANDLPHGVGKYLSDDATQNVYRLERGEIVSSSVNSYAPPCGKAPEVKHKPAVQNCSFKPIIEKDAMWIGESSSGKSGVIDFIKRVVNEEPAWIAYEQNEVRIDPTKQIPMEHISNLSPPLPPQ